MPRKSEILVCKPVSKPQHLSATPAPPPPSPPSPIAERCETVSIRPFSRNCYICPPFAREICLWNFMSFEKYNVECNRWKSSSKNVEEEADSGSEQPIIIRRRGKRLRKRKCRRGSTYGQQTEVRDPLEPTVTQVSQIGNGSRRPSLVFTKIYIKIYRNNIFF